MVKKYLKNKITLLFNYLLKYTYWLLQSICIIIIIVSNNKMEVSLFVNLNLDLNYSPIVLHPIQK